MKTSITLTIALLGFTASINGQAQAMTEYERASLAVQQAMLKNAELTGLVQRCHVYKQYLATAFQTPENCDAVFKAKTTPETDISKPQQCQANPFNGRCL